MLGQTSTHFHGFPDFLMDAMSVDDIGGRGTLTQSLLPLVWVQHDLAGGSTYKHGLATKQERKPFIEHTVTILHVFI